MLFNTSAFVRGSFEVYRNTLGIMLFYVVVGTAALFYGRTRVF